MTVTPGKAAQSAASKTLPATPDAVAPDGVPLRPLPVSLTSRSHEWTSNDATDPKVIEKIARNPEEAVKMLEENDRILRRQLVYRTEPVAKLLQQSRLSGKPVTRFTLPGLDGQELEVEVISSDLAPSGQTGTFHGRLAGCPQSLVTLAFEFGIEAYTILSPENGVHLQADPRESGELIVRSFDPDKFMPFQCGDRDHE
ncbi:MAG: hypothetical protein H7A49_04440 [Akkermansiaceae bacterium]|nr:hypothetical protein [Akkermansiaceae bacterium]MCP5547387.1 hypothetical protein [Akkermansiaceae bacterium]